MTGYTPKTHTTLLAPHCNFLIRKSMKKENGGSDDSGSENTSSGVSLQKADVCEHYSLLPPLYLLVSNMFHRLHPYQPHMKK